MDYLQDVMKLSYADNKGDYLDMKKMLIDHNVIEGDR
jgi:hypothetical protein